MDALECSKPLSFTSGRRGSSRIRIKGTMENTRTLPVPGDFYRHFKNRMYQIVAIAYHSETEEAMVVYQAQYGEKKVWVRPLAMFMEEVDHVKYPDVTQKYRFEKVEENAEEVAEYTMSPHLLAFFDAMDEKHYDKMLEALAKLSGHASQKEIDDICMVLDMQTVGDTVAEQISEIRRHIQMIRKFDGERLR